MSKSVDGSSEAHNAWSHLKRINLKKLTDLLNHFGPLEIPLHYDTDPTLGLIKIIIGLGVLHQTSEKWQLRGGYAKDNSPVPSDALRTMTIPDSDRTWLSGGARYQMDETTSIDLGYAHIMFADAKTAREVKDEGVVIQTIQGSFDNEVNLFSVQFNKSF